MFHLAVNFGTPEVRDAAVPSHDVSAIIGMSGDVEGTVVLSFPSDTARRVVAVFTGSDAPLSNEDLSDAIGEVVNMVAGGAKAQFNGKSISISCPSVVVGGHKIYGAKDSITVAIPCTCDCGEFSVEVAMRGAAAAALSPSRQAA
jgi:chemotaxis protein CheX